MNSPTDDASLQCWVKKWKKRGLHEIQADFSKRPVNFTYPDYRSMVKSSTLVQAKKWDESLET